MAAKQIAFYTFIFFASLLLYSCSSNRNQLKWVVCSPDEKIKVQITFQEINGTVFYEVFNTGDSVINLSPLGITKENQSFDSLLCFVKSDPIKEIHDEYKLVSGKRLVNHNNANELTLYFKNVDGSLMHLIFRAYNDGIAFRYFLPQQGSHPIKSESTGFQIPLNSIAWLQPYDSVTRWSPAYEKYFMNGIPIGERSPSATGWCFPALFRVKENWVLITESNLLPGFFGSHLAPDSKGGLYQMRGVEDDEPETKYAFEGSLSRIAPWRVIIVGRSLSTIVESNLVSNLAMPSPNHDMSWIRPGKSSWSWWSDHKSSTKFEALKSFIDLSAEMGWEYSLIDAGWDQMKSGSLKELVDYGNEKKVGVWLWYNSGGDHNTVKDTPRNKMSDPLIRKQEMQMLHRLGVRGVKIDFFQSEKQSAIQYYWDILQDAYDNKLMVNFHGCTIPRGWSKTWPHLLSMEAVRGEETYSFGEEFPVKAAELNTILPFTRNVVGSMDYTPVGLSNLRFKHITTLAHELALTIVFESGIVHLADRVKTYSDLDAQTKQFLKEVPTVWEETKLLEGYPGDYVVMARRSGDDWYLGLINGKFSEKEVTIDFSFLGNGNYLMKSIKDNLANSNLFHESDSINTKSHLNAILKPAGGLVIIIKPKKI